MYSIKTVPRNEQLELLLQRYYYNLEMAEDLKKEITKCAKKKDYKFTVNIKYDSGNKVSFPLGKDHNFPPI